MKTKTQHDRKHGNICSDTCEACEQKQHSDSDGAKRHTPTPWIRTHQVNTDGTNDIVANGKVIAHLGGSLKGDDQYSTDAEFIIRAVNSHEALLEALKRFMAFDGRYGELAGHEKMDDVDFAFNLKNLKEQALKAIAQAEGKED